MSQPGTQSGGGNGGEAEELAAKLCRIQLLVDGIRYLLAAMAYQAAVKSPGDIKVTLALVVCVIASAGLNDYANSGHVAIGVAHGVERPQMLVSLMRQLIEVRFLHNAS